MLASAYLIAAMLNTVYAVFDVNVWAAPANTILLLILWYVSKREHKKSQRGIDHAASAAASAAKAALDTARISKELGSIIRTHDLPLKAESRNG